MQDRDVFGQFGKPDKMTLSWNTFWKIVLAMTISSLIILCIFLLFGYFNQPQSDPLAQEEALQYQAEKSMRELESVLFEKWDTIAQSLDQTLPLNGEINESDIMSWIESKPNLLSVSILESDKQFPVQFVPARFWESKIIQELQGTERQSLVQLIFSNNTDTLSTEISLLRISSAVNPLVRVTTNSSIENREYVFAQELMPVAPVLTQIQLSNIQYTLVDLNGISLANNTEGLVPTGAKEQISKSASSPRLGWKLTLTESLKTSSKSPILTHPLLYPVSTLLVIMILVFIASMTTRWIDKPMEPLYDTAMRISRGDFSLRLPGSSSKNSNRLTRLINYMVEEMEHLQQINVSKILVEKKKTETILKNIADAVIVTDNADHILVLNAVAEKWFDCLESVVLHQDLTQILKERPLIQMIQRVREKGQPDSSEFQIRILEHAQPKTLHAHGAPVKSQDDRQIGVVTVLRDVSEEREVERLKTELVSMVAHELKSPLTSIYGFSELLLKSELKDEKSKEYSRVILNESSRLTDLINKFLDLSKLESGTTEPQLRPFEIQESIQRMLDAHGQMASRKKIRIIFDAVRSIPNVLADPDLIDQVLLNLFSNAVKYSPSGSKVGIEVKTEGRYVTVQLIDNGHGISKNAMPKIFDKFYRAADTGDENVQNGSGLGLSLVKEIVERLGGKVHVHSQVGVGSIFSFSLPQAVG